MLDWLYIALGKMLGFLSFGGSYAIGLLFYALIFKIAFVFFAIKQQKNQIKMAKLTPKIALIRAKYRGRNDQATMRKQQEEIMKLQQDEGYSPLAGCLPLLIQMPLIIFLYNVIRRPLSYIAGVSSDVINFFSNHWGIGADNEIEIAGRLKQLQMKGIPTEQITSQNAADYTAALNGIEGMTSDKLDSIIESLPNFNFFGLNLAETPRVASWLILIPIFVAVFQWLSMFVMRKVNTNPMQTMQQDEQTQMSMKVMDITMPLITLFFAFKLPAVMGVYWIYQSVFGMLQSVAIAYAMPIPKFTPEELKMLEKARRQQQKEQKEIIKAQPKYKSLHYIDEDDYDELPEVKKVNSNVKKDNKPAGNNKPEIKD